MWKKRQLPFALLLFLSIKIMSFYNEKGIAPFLLQSCWDIQAWYLMEWIEMPISSQVSWAPQPPSVLRWKGSSGHLEAIWDWNMDHWWALQLSFKGFGMGEGKKYSSNDVMPFHTLCHRKRLVLVILAIRFDITSWSRLRPLRLKPEGNDKATTSVW